MMNLESSPEIRIFFCKTCCCEISQLEERCICNVCRASFHKSCDDNESNFGGSAEGWRCSSCLDAIKVHLEIVQSKSLNRNSRIICPMCGKEFASHGGLSYHKRKLVCTKIDQQESTIALADKVPQNTDQDASSTTTDLIRRKLEGDGPFFCWVCSKQFKSFPGYNYHILRKVCHKDRGFPTVVEEESSNVHAQKRNRKLSLKALESLVTEIDPTEEDGELPKMKLNSLETVDTDVFSGSGIKTINTDVKDGGKLSTDHPNNILEVQDNLPLQQQPTEVQIRKPETKGGAVLEAYASGSSTGVLEPEKLSTKRLKTTSSSGNSFSNAAPNTNVTVQAPIAAMTPANPSLLLRQSCRSQLAQWREGYVSKYVIKRSLDLLQSLSGMQSYDIWSERDRGRDVVTWESFRDWFPKHNITCPEVVLKVRTPIGKFDSIPSEFSAGPPKSGLHMMNIMIPPYRGVLVPRSTTPLDPNTLDFMANAGGPIWSLKFVPTWLPFVPRRYVIVGTSRIGFTKAQRVNEAASDQNEVGGDDTYVLGEKHTHPNLLQIWCFESYSTNPSAGMSDHTSTFSPSPPKVNYGIPREVKLGYFVSLPRSGPIWSIDCLDHSTRTSDRDRAGLGIFNVVCGDGSCKILSLPKIIKSDDNRVLQEDSVLLCSLIASDALVLCSAWVSNTGNSLLHHPSVTLNDMQRNSFNIGPSSSNHTEDPIPKKSIVKVVGGLSDGTIGLWSFDLLEIDRKGLIEPIMKFCDNQVDRTVPSFSAIRSISCCPYQPDLFLTTGYDGAFKVWNMDNKTTPQYMKKPYLGWLMDACWDVLGHGVYCGGSETPAVFWDTMWSETGDSSRRSTVYNHISSHGAIWKLKAFSHDGVSSIASVASDGSVRQAIVPLTTGRVRNVSCPYGPNMATQTFLVKSVGSEKYDVNYGKYAEVDVDLMNNHLPSSSATSLNNGAMIDKRTFSLTDPAVAMHALDIAPPDTFQARETKDDKVERLITYGGAAGLFRIHTFDSTHYCVRTPEL